MTIPYTTGTVSVTAGSAIVTGSGTNWQTVGFPLGLFGAAGLAVPVASIDSDTQLTLEFEWPGDTASGLEYWYADWKSQLTTQNAQRLAEYIARLNNPALAAAAGVTPAANKVLLFTGANTATLIDLEELLQPIKFDAEVPALAGRAAYDGQPKDFRVLVADVGDGRSAFYTKLSNASADWSVPFYISGTVGPAGVANPRGTYAAGTAYAKNDLVLNNGSSWIAKVATTGNAPPTLPTTSNTWWQLAAAKGTDGTGTGDVVGPNGGVAVKQIAGFGATNGKTIVGLTAAEARASIDAGVLAGFRNKIINGGFTNALRSQGSAVGPGFLFDRWQMVGGGLQNILVLPAADRAVTGTDVYQGITAFGPAAVTVSIQQGIENVDTLAGKFVTVIFYAKGTVAGMPVSASLVQNFGSGGSPSAPVLTPVPLSGSSLSTGMTRFVGLVQLPPTISKTKGTNKNDALFLKIDRGSGFEGNITLTKVFVLEGDATKEEDPPQLPREIVDLQCSRFCAAVQTVVDPAVSYRMVDLPHNFRDYPAWSVRADVVGTAFTLTTFSNNGLPIPRGAFITSANKVAQVTIIFEAELGL